jgi:hypothetical protein
MKTAFIVSLALALSAVAAPSFQKPAAGGQAAGAAAAKAAAAKGAAAKASGASSAKAAGAKGGNTGAAATSVAASTAAEAASATSAAASTATAAASTNSTDSGTAATSGIQASLTLDSSVIASGFLDDGQNPPVAGQAASLTSGNNYINFCSGQTITNGLQVTAGSCNPAPMGQIPASTKIPSAKFQNPVNGQVLPSNVAFTIDMAVSNLQAGLFTNAAKTYYSAPQQLNSQGIIEGHTHFVIEAMTSMTQTTVTNPLVFQFFKGVDTAAVNGVISQPVTAGLPAGTYRLGSINAATNHQPVLAPIAQHGIMDDVVYFVVSDSAPGAVSNAAASSAAAAAAAATAAAGNSTVAATSAAAVTSAAVTSAAATKAAATKAATTAKAAAATKAASKGGKANGKARSYFY